MYWSFYTFLPPASQDVPPRYMLDASSTSWVHLRGGLRGFAPDTKKSASGPWGSRLLRYNKAYDVHLELTGLPQKPFFPSSRNPHLHSNRKLSSRRDDYLTLPTFQTRSVTLQSGSKVRGVMCEMKLWAVFTFDSNYFEGRCSNVGVLFELGWVSMQASLSPDSSGNKVKHV